MIQKISGEVGQSFIKFLERHCTKNEVFRKGLTFTEEKLNGKLHFLCSEATRVIKQISIKRGMYVHSNPSHVCTSIM